jgi:hypothetical protein
LRRFQRRLTSRGLGFQIPLSRRKPLGAITAGPGRHSNRELGADGHLYICYARKVARLAVKARPVRLGRIS